MAAVSGAASPIINATILQRLMILAIACWQRRYTYHTTDFDPPPPPRTDYFDIGSECSRDFDQSSNFGNPLDIVRLIDFPSTCHSIYIYSLVSLDYEISCIRIVITKLIYLTGRWRKEDIDT